MIDECQLAFEEIAGMILPDVWPPLPAGPSISLTVAAFAFGTLCGAAVLAATRARPFNRAKNAQERTLGRVTSPGGAPAPTGRQDGLA